jgi:hypothetical protein
MMLTGNAARVHGITFSDPAQMANDLHASSGEFVRSAILLLMINAAVLGTSAISLSSSWAYGEVSIPQLVSNLERNSVRMSWVVVTDSAGDRQLQMQWASSEANLRRRCSRVSRS